MKTHTGFCLADYDENNETCKTCLTLKECLEMRDAEILAARKKIIDKFDLWWSENGYKYKPKTKIEKDAILRNLLTTVKNWARKAYEQAYNDKQPN